MKMRAIRTKTKVQLVEVRTPGWSWGRRLLEDTLPASDRGLKVSVTPAKSASLTSSNRFSEDTDEFPIFVMFLENTSVHSNFPLGGLEEFVPEASIVCVIFKQRNYEPIKLGH